MCNLYLKKVLLAVALFTSASAHAAIIYSDRLSFESTLGDMIVDDYSDPAYRVGDHRNLSSFDNFTDAGISGVLGETSYSSTGAPNRNYIIAQSNSEFAYCSGCNGSFLLDFTSTSIGSELGVFGVGLNVFGNETVFGTTAFVTFGNNSTANYAIPNAEIGETPFWGITSDLLVSSIHFGLPNGVSNTDNQVQRMALDNLTIGNAIQVPSSAVFWLFVSGLGVVLRRRR